MITKKEYEKAVDIVATYEAQQNEMLTQMREVMRKFPIGMTVESCKCKLCMGRIIEYDTEDGKLRLVCVDADGLALRMEVDEAVEVPLCAPWSWSR